MSGNGKKEELPPDHDKAEAAKPVDEAQKLFEECAALRDKYLRMVAEFDNARKRWDRDKEDLLKFGNVALLRDLVTVADELEQAVKMARAHKGDAEILKGLEMTQRNFMGVLKKNGLEVVEAAGKKFDPHLHEIAGMQDVETDDKDHVVIEEIQKGYLCEGKVLRTSKVVVGIKKEKEILEEGNG